MGTEEILKNILNEMRKPDFATPALYFFSTVAQTMGAIIAIVLAALYSIIPFIMQKNNDASSSVLIRLLKKDDNLLTAIYSGFITIALGLLGLLLIYISHMDQNIALIMLYSFGIMSIFAGIISCCNIIYFVFFKMSIYQHPQEFEKEFAKYKKLLYKYRTNSIYTINVIETLIICNSITSTLNNNKINTISIPMLKSEYALKLLDNIISDFSQFTNTNTYFIYKYLLYYTIMYCDLITYKSTNIDKNDLLPKICQLYDKLCIYNDKLIIDEMINYNLSKISTSIRYFTNSISDEINENDYAIFSFIEAVNHILSNYDVNLSTIEISNITNAMFSFINTFKTQKINENIIKIFVYFITNCIFNIINSKNPNKGLFSLLHKHLTDITKIDQKMYNYSYSCAIKENDESSVRNLAYLISIGKGIILDKSYKIKSINKDRIVTEATKLSNEFNFNISSMNKNTDAFLKQNAIHNVADKIIER